ncbi:MAG: ABC transporter ATP-binding protein [Deltaproteobacteria bacterium]|nr:ABC transporter ATP-binding protein [Deltaproteobacteria bacterium]
MSSNSLLKTKINYVKTLDGLYILRDIEFEIFGRETVCIIGESGSGKTMTGYCLMGLLPQNLISDYEVYFTKEGKIYSNPEEYRGKEITMIFQEPMTALNPVFSIGNQLIEVVRRNNTLKEKVVLDALRSVGIKNPDKVFHSYPHQLSGGMRQRILIAMAFLPGPSIVIADEPTTALDVTMSSGILSLIDFLKNSKGTSLIFISHDLNIVEKMADRIIVMYGGTIMEEGNKTDILNKPLHPYTIALKRLFEERKNTYNSRLPEIKGYVPSIKDMPKGCPFNPRCENVINICKRELPPLTIKYENHKVRCFNYHSY